MKKYMLLFGLILSLSIQIHSQIMLESHWGGGTCEATAIAENIVLVGFGSYLYAIDNETFETLGKVIMPNIIKDIEILDNSAFIALDGDGIYVIDISNPLNMSVVLKLEGYARRLNLSDNTLYVASYFSGLMIYDISDKSNPELLGALDISEIVYDVIPNGNYLYCAGGSAGLVVIDQSDPSNLSQLETIPSSKNIYNLLIYNHYLYASCNAYDRMDIYSLSTARTPELKSTFDDGEPIYEMIMLGSKMFASGYSAGLREFNLSSPTNPVVENVYDVEINERFSINDKVLVIYDDWEGVSLFKVNEGEIDLTPSEYELDFSNLDMVSSGDGLLYFPIYNGGTRVIDLSNPLLPKDYGEIDWDIDDVVTEGPYSYMICEDTIKTVNMADPSNPTLLRKVGLVMDQASIYLKGNKLVAYGNKSSYGMHLIDITEPENPIVNDFIHHNASFNAICIVEDALFALDRNKQLFRVNISESSDPVVESEPVFSDSIVGCWERNNYLYVTNSDYILSIYDASDPFNPKLENTFSCQYLIACPPFSGNIAYAPGFMGIDSYNFDDPTVPYTTAHISIGGYFGSYAIINNRLIVHKIIVENKLSMYDLSSPVQPGYVGTVMPFGINNSVSAKDDIALIANNVGGFRVTNFKEEPPADIENIYISESASCSAIEDNIAYLVDKSGNMKIYDLLDEESPKLYGKYNSEKNISCAKIIVKDNYAYLVGSYLLKVIDISNKNSPVEVASISVGSKGSSGFIYNDYLYFCDQSYGIEIVNISTPTNPIVASTYNTPSTAMDIFIKNDIAYVADGYSSLLLLDVSNPTHPVEISEYTIDYAFINSVEIYEQYAIVGVAYSGVYILDVSDPQNVTFVDRYYINGCSLTDIFLDETSIYACDQEYGVYKLSTPIFTSVDENDNSLPVEYCLEQNYPNPFNPTTTIKFTIPYVESKSTNSLSTKLIVYDILGQEVVTLINEKKTPGVYEVQFNGRNLSSGVYFYTLTSGNYSNVKKMMLLR